MIDLPIQTVGDEINSFTDGYSTEKSAALGMKHFCIYEVPVTIRYVAARGSMTNSDQTRSITAIKVWCQVYRTTQ